MRSQQQNRIENARLEQERLEIERLEQERQVQEKLEHEKLLKEINTKCINDYIFSLVNNDQKDFLIGDASGHERDGQYRNIRYITGSLINVSKNETTGFCLELTYHGPGKLSDYNWPDDYKSYSYIIY